MLVLSYCLIFSPPWVHVKLKIKVKSCPPFTQIYNMNLERNSKKHFCFKPVLAILKTKQFLLQGNVQLGKNCFYLAIILSLDKKP